MENILEKGDGVVVYYRPYCHPETFRIEKFCRSQSIPVTVKPWTTACGDYLGLASLVTKTSDPDEGLYTEEDFYCAIGNTRANQRIQTLTVWNRGTDAGAAVNLSGHDEGLLTLGEVFGNEPSH